MKKNIIFISFYSVALILFSCSNSEQSENALGTNGYLCVSDFSEYGELHNAFMDNMQNNYQRLDNEISSLNEFYEDLNRFHTDFAKTIISTSFDYDLFAKTMDKYKRLVVVDQFMSNAFTRKNTRADDGYIDLEKFCLKDSFQIEDIPNLRTLAYQMYKQNYLSDNAYNLLKDLIDIVSDNYLGLSSDAVFLEKLDETMSRFDRIGFSNESVEGNNIGEVLAISKSSAEWWINHPEASDSSVKIAPWVAVDVAGAIFGAFQNIIGQNVTGGSNINVKSLLFDTLCGAVMTSTCATAKAMKFAKEFADDLIKVYFL